MICAVPSPICRPSTSRRRCSYGISVLYAPRPLISRQLCTTSKASFGPRDSRDRRACQIELTDPGLRLAVAAHDDVRARLRTLTGDLSADDKAHLASVITQILDRRSEADATARQL